MKTVEKIQEDLNTQIADYRANAGKWTSKQIDASNEKVKTLQTELSDTIAGGAKPHDKCRTKPFGMIRRVITENNFNFPIYEVGCLACPPEKKGNRRVSYSAQGATPNEAVERWNKGEYLEDSK